MSLMIAAPGSAQLLGGSGGGMVGGNLGGAGSAAAGGVLGDTLGRTTGNGAGSATSDGSVRTHRSVNARDGRARRIG